MSIEDAKEFGKKIAEDETVRNRAKEIGFNIEDIIAYAKELGLDFNEEDLKALAEEAGFKEDELTEEQLEKIAGGIATVTVAGLAGTAAICGAVIGGGGVAALGGVSALGGSVVGGLVAAAIGASDW